MRKLAIILLGLLIFMSHQQFSSQLPSQNSDEIDLIELFQILWVKKLWIILITFIFTAIAAVYAFTAKEQWTSKAEIIPPKLVDLNTYFNLRNEYARILGYNFDANTVLSSLYSRFNQLSYSIDERENFFKQTSFYKSLALEKTEDQKRRILNTLARKNITIVKPDSKDDPDALGTKYMLHSDSPKLSQDTLISFINYLSNRSSELELQSFLILYNNKISDLIFEQNQIESNLTIQKQVQLNNLRKAFEIAKSAGIKEYSMAVKNSDNSFSSLLVSDTKIPLTDSRLSDGTYLFMLGEKYIKAQQEVLARDPIIYPPRYYQIKKQLEKLVPLLDKFQLSDARSFSYLNSPDYPMIKDKPRKLLILLVGMILGMFFSVVGIISFHFVRRI